MDEAAAELADQIQHPTQESLPVVRTITRLRSLDECGLWFDPGSTRIAESRSRGFHEALNSNCDVWFACDDDCEATLDTLRWMVEAVKTSSGICLAPYWCRYSQTQEPRVSLQVRAMAEGESPEYRDLPNGGRTMPALWGGFGLVAMSRQAMVDMAEHNRNLTYTDKLGVQRLALFLEHIEGQSWLPEDNAFFKRLPDTVKVEALVTGVTMHNGRVLDLRLLQDGYATMEAMREPSNPESSASS